MSDKLNSPQPKYMTDVRFYLFYYHRKNKWQTQGASITVQGGLDLVSSSHALFRTPGAATKLQNF